MQRLNRCHQNRSRVGGFTSPSQAPSTGGVVAPAAAADPDAKEKKDSMVLISLRSMVYEMRYLDFPSSSSGWLS
ncbi:hypothetical protein LINPERPRIM_LOCUS20035 [Linum perenne]